MQRPTCLKCGNVSPRVNIAHLECSTCKQMTPHRIQLMTGVPARRKKALERLNTHRKYWKNNFKQILESMTFYLVMADDQHGLFLNSKDAAEWKNNCGGGEMIEIKIS